MHIWLAQPLLQQEADCAYPTTNLMWSSRSIVGIFPSLWGAMVPIWGASEMGDVQDGTVYIWNRPFGKMFWGYVNKLQSNYPRWTWNGLQRGAFTRHPLIVMIRIWSCAIHTWDVELSMFSFAGYLIQSVASCVVTEMDAMDSIVLSTCHACCTIQLLWHMLSPLHCPLQQHVYEWC